VINRFLPPRYDAYLPMAMLSLWFLPNLPTGRLVTQLKQSKALLDQSNEKLKIAKAVLSTGMVTKEDTETSAALISDAELSQAKAKQALGNALGKFSDNSALEVRKEQIKAKENMEIELNDSSPDELNRPPL
jgi:hypothetical protein